MSFAVVGVPNQEERWVRPHLGSEALLHVDGSCNGCLGRASFGGLLRD